MMIWETCALKNKSVQFPFWCFLLQVCFPSFIYVHLHSLFLWYTAGSNSSSSVSSNST
ncbi:hypothetical protein BDB00DRAFT_803429 [Zychaea mexicana]|uniref:uncharacterized protein n=1 Tax=Zychaea mexicana TaxID=64656 RepID=UPI0022FDB462|nr:uncharacterized protein BDB00DRAFT_803429 [Zychaea mexicana]KAI9497630.1 hypothetical protein BDB00DRAFT_803429 [Zychaea mexicana]